MKSTVENTGGLSRKLEISVPAETVSGAFDRIFKNIQKNADLKGFRKGKAPLETIKKMYADRVQQDVAQDLVSQGYTKALQEHDLTPITQPQVKFDSLDADKEFSFTAEFEIRPEVELKNYEGLKVEKEKLDVNDERINQVLERVRESKATEVPVLEDRPAQEGDIAEIDFFGKVNGEPLEGGEAKGYKLGLGTNSFIPGFEEGVIGMKIGQTKTLNLKFPDEYGNADIAGKPVSFDVTLHKLHKKSLPELNDALAKEVGDFENLEALKDIIRKDLEAEDSHRIKEDMKSRLLKALVEANPVEVPQQLHAQQKAALMADVEKRLGQQQMSPADIEEYKKKWDSDFNETADFMIQSSFLIDALAEKYNITATKKELEDRLRQYSQQTGIDFERVKEFYGEGSRMGNLEYQIIEAKVVDKLEELSDVKEVPADQLKKDEK